MTRCQHCQGEFQKARKEQVYCSKSCASVRKGAMRKGQKTGPQKGKVYKQSTDSDGYLKVFAVLHPFRDGRKMIAEHVIVMELSIGRRIRKTEVVHHRNGDRKDNRLVNLQLMTRSEHSKLHGKETAAKRTRRKDGTFA